MFDGVEPVEPPPRQYANLGTSFPTGLTWAQMPYVPWLLALIDSVGIFLAALGLIHWLSLPKAGIGYGVLAAVMFPVVLKALGLYDLRVVMGWPMGALRTVATWCASVVALTGLMTLLGVSGAVANEFVLPWGGVVAVGLVGGRAVAAASLGHAMSHGRFRRRAAIVGATPRVGEMIANAAAPDVDFVAIYDDRISRVPEELEKLPVIGTTDTLFDHVREGRIDLVVIALPWAAIARNAAIVRRLRELPIDVVLVPEFDSRLLPPRGLMWLGGVPAVFASRRPLSRSQAVAKWLQDKVLASLLLVATAPLMAAAAVAIKLTSRGPVLFRQERFGLNSKVIGVLKFRTMYVDDTDTQGEVCTVPGDSRVTPVGKVLRRLSIDELPQLINVLAGDMSLVGPRAHAVKMSVGGRVYHEAVADYAVRHRVKPGITGWAQINGSRGAIITQEQAEERVRYDLQYIDNWSLFLDLRILLATAALVLFDPHKTAY